MNAEAEKVAAQTVLGDNVACIRRHEFVGGTMRVWETQRSMPVLRACTMQLGGEALVLNRGLEEFERGLAALKPDVAKVEEFREFFELAAPGLRRFVDPERPEARSLDSDNPKIGPDEAQWIVDDYESGLVEEFRMDRRTYALDRRVVGRCAIIPLM
jgi:hypothetical protein